jgi:hypothetical protein
MADYYPLLAKAVVGLPNSTAETRHAIYERARKALFGQLRSLDPPVAEEAIEREAQALERAVAQLETELTSPIGSESGALPAGTDFAGSGSPAATVPALEPSTASLAKPASQDRGAFGRAPSAKVTAPAARMPRPPVPPLKVRRETSAASPVAPSIGAPQPSKASNHKGPTSLSGLTPGAPSTSNPFATQDESRVSAAGIAANGQAAFSGPDFQPFAEGASGPEAPILNAPSFETLAQEAPSTSLEGYEPAARTRLEAQRPFAPRLEGDTGAIKRAGIVVGIVGLVVVLVAIAAYKLRDRPEDLVRLQASSPAIQGEAGSGGKIVDRVEAGGATPGAPTAGAGVPSSTAERNDGAKSGSGPANPALPVARRAALLMEAPEEQSKVKTLLGTVVWRVDNVSNGPDEPLSMAVRAEAEIPEEGLQAAIIIQKNFDSTLPASHTIKLRFSVRPGSPLANIKQVNVLLRRADSPTGDALKGITVPVTENSFLIGLSRGDGEASNLDLMRSREWFDIPIVLANGHIAKLTFEKGPSGRSALDDALASWQAQ